MNNVIVENVPFIPNLSFWGRLINSDQLITASGLHYDKRHHLNVCDLEGCPIVVPVDKASTKGRLWDVSVSSSFSAKKVAKRIRIDYMKSKYKYGGRLEPLVNTLESIECTSLYDLNLTVFRSLCSILGVTIDTIDYGLDLDARDLTQSVIAKILKHSYCIGEDVSYVTTMRAAPYLNKRVLKVGGLSTQTLVDNATKLVSGPAGILQVIANVKYPTDAINDMCFWIHD